MSNYPLGRALARGACVSALAVSMMSTSVFGQSVDLSKWSPEYVRSIAGTETYNTAEQCGAVTPLDYEGKLTFWYQGVFEGDPDLLRQYYKDFFAAFRETYRKECLGARIDYVPLHTGMPFDKALMEYLLSRQARG